MTVKVNRFYWLIFFAKEKRHQFSLLLSSLYMSKLNSTIYVKVEGDLERWGCEGRYLGGGGKGTKQGRGGKNRQACVIPSPHPSRSWGWGRWWDYTCSSALFSSSLFHPLTPPFHTPSPSPFKISPYLHLNSWIQLSTLTLLVKSGRLEALELLFVIFSVDHFDK